MSEKQNKIFFAQITNTGNFFTTVTVNFAGKTVERMFVGDNHTGDADEYVREWNAHFSEEWRRMCEVSTAAMCMLIKMLRLNGVSEKTLTSSIRGAQTYAG